MCYGTFDEETFLPNDFNSTRRALLRLALKAVGDPESLHLIVEPANTARQVADFIGPLAPAMSAIEYLSAESGKLPPPLVYLPELLSSRSSMTGANAHDAWWKGVQTWYKIYHWTVRFHQSEEAHTSIPSDYPASLVLPQLPESQNSSAAAVCQDLPQSSVIASVGLAVTQSVCSLWGPDELICVLLYGGALLPTFRPNSSDADIRVILNTTSITNTLLFQSRRIALHKVLSDVLTSASIPISGLDIYFDVYPENVTRARLRIASVRFAVLHGSLPPGFLLPNPTWLILNWNITSNELKTANSIRHIQVPASEKRFEAAVYSFTKLLLHVICRLKILLDLRPWQWPTVGEALKGSNAFVSADALLLVDAWRNRNESHRSVSTLYSIWSLTCTCWRQLQIWFNSIDFQSVFRRWDALQDSVYLAGSCPLYLLELTESTACYLPDLPGSVQQDQACHLGLGSNSVARGAG